MPQPSPQTSAPISTTPSLRRRMACWLYEGLLLFAIVFVGGLIANAIGVFFGAPPPRSLMQVIWLLLLGLYFVGFWSHGQTVAMKTWNIAVVNQHGRRLTRLRALTRYAMSWLWVMPPLIATLPFQLPMAQLMTLTLGWVAVWALLSRFQPERQFWHDIFAGTRLVNTPKATKAQRPLSA